MENQTFISCVAWIQRGFAAKVPLQVQIPQEQIQQMKEDPLMKQELEKQRGQLLAQQMENQDDELPVFGQDINGLRNGGKYPDMIEDLEEDQQEDYFIKDSDLLIVSGKVEKQFSSLQVYVYEQENSNLFVHHEIMLSSFPLSLEWLNVDLGSINSNSPSKGNYAIVSTFLPEIQIWNLDMAEAVEPDLILGGQLISNKKKPKKFTNKSKKWKEGSHTDSVISLSLNFSHRNILASGSADSTMKIWDLGQAKNIYTSNHHSSRVNKVKWSPVDPTIIFTAGEDKKLIVLDSRFPNDRLVHSIHETQSIQSACWNINNPSQICYTTDQGRLHLIDVRSMEKPVATICPQKGITLTDVKIGRKNLCYVCSEDSMVSIWNINSLQTPVGYKKPKCGKMYCLDVIESDEGPIVTCGNQKGQLFVWDITQNQQVNNYWKSN